ncbi:galactose mutarotase-like [Pollicipes pollicipes]|uniref:galactose mutarotase-like n=1 Tax=Pollicipes pollicipes TaxID=41117 RepID=UPI001884D609|nr:galactose mutarotase-like [Pollicipes pollicipes]XP_037073186.1 galactose mutarotase-like [Pollicipes pollicipes]
MRTVAEDNFGVHRPAGQPAVPVRRFTLTNPAGTEAQVINYGARLTSLKVKDKHGRLVDVVLGEDSYEKYVSNTCYFGCTVGRVANRIAGGKFVLNGQEVNVKVNRPPVHLHGGQVGFDKQLWGSHVEGDSVTFTYVSRHGEEGYPGQLTTHVTYQLTDDNQLTIRYRAMSDRPTPVNLTNHTYWNLAGHGAGRDELLRHQVTINAATYLEVDENCLVTGRQCSVNGSGYDFRVSRPLSEALAALPPGGGFDNNYCLERPGDGGVGTAARVVSPDSGVAMEVLTDQPGVQFYTGNFLPADGAPGKEGATYGRQGAFCLETQKYPDAVNHPEFPSTIVNPGELYQHTCIYQFSVDNSC